MMSDLLQLINALKWNNISEGGAERKEEILIKMRFVINTELRKVRADIKAENGGD